ncbi:hypothetical protein ACFL3V_01815 [Nanoarchaeota archaeon]
MNIEIWTLLPVAIILGIVSSHSDFKEGKIQNKYLIMAVIASVILHGFLWAFHIIENHQLLIKISHMIISSVIGIALYSLNLWSGGDAKLYIAFVSLLPEYSFTLFGMAPITILAGTFLLLLIYLVLKSIFQTTKDQKITLLKKILNPKNLGHSLLVIFAISWIITSIFTHFGIEKNIAYSIILIFFIYRALNYLFKEESIYLIALIAILRVFFNSDHILRTEFIISFLVMTAAYILVFKSLLEIPDLFCKKVKIYKLTKDMWSREGVTMKGYLTEDRSQKNLVPPNKRLDEADLYRLRNNAAKGKLHINSLLVYEKISFAPLLFGGTILNFIFIIIR